MTKMCSTYLLSYSPDSRFAFSKGSERKLKSSGAQGNERLPPDFQASDALSAGLPFQIEAELAAGDLVLLQSNCRSSLSTTDSLPSEIACFRPPSVLSWSSSDRSKGAETGSPRRPPGRGARRFPKTSSAVAGRLGRPDRHRTRVESCSRSAAMWIAAAPVVLALAAAAAAAAAKHQRRTLPDPRAGGRGHPRFIRRRARRVSSPPGSVRRPVHRNRALGGRARHAGDNRRHVRRRGSHGPARSKALTGGDRPAERAAPLARENQALALACAAPSKVAVSGAGRLRR